MRTMFRGVLFGLFGLLLQTPQASARRIAIPPLPDRIGRADAIVIGKVASLEDKKIKLPGRGGEGVLAVLKVASGFGGAKGLTHVQVAVPAGQLEASQEACFFLEQVKGESYYSLGLRPFFSMIRKDDGNYAAQLDAIKRCGAILDDPKKGLEAKDPKDQLLAAALLLARHRPWGQGAEKTEPIDAAQSKAILSALAAADWKQTDNVTQVNAQTLFFRLGLTPADGWKQPNFQQLEAVAKEWLKANAGTYRVKRFVLN